MLRETLQQLLNTPHGRSRDCKLGKIILSQDKETAEIFIETLKSGASTMGLVRALKEEGIFLSREYLGEKRASCFKDENKSCCLNIQNTAEEDKK